jgi:hypothetical protein
MSVDRQIDEGSGQSKGLILAIPGNDERPFVDYGTRQPIPTYSTTGVTPGFFGNTKLTTFPGSQGLRVPRILPSLNEFSVCQWFVQNSNAGTYFSLSNRIANTANGIVILYEQLWGPEVAFLNGGALTRAKYNTPLAAGSLNHLCGCHDKDANTIRLYLNGTLSGTMIETGATSPGNAGEVYLGVDGIASTPYFFAGGIFDTRIYNRALSSAEVMNIYRNTMALYKLDDEDNLELFESLFKSYFAQSSMICQ